jgi:hypothetical protein
MPTTKKPRLLADCPYVGVPAFVSRAHAEFIEAAPSPAVAESHRRYIGARSSDAFSRCKEAADDREHRSRSLNIRGVANGFGAGLVPAPNLPAMLKKLPWSGKHRWLSDYYRSFPKIDVVE